MHTSGVCDYLTPRSNLEQSVGEPAVPLQVIETRLAQIEQSIRELQVERQMLFRLRSQAVHMKPTGKRRPSGEVILESDAKQGPSGAILALVAQEPGLKTEQIADRLKDKIITKSPDPRRVLVNTVANLVNRKRLKADPTGGYVLVE